MMDSIVCKSQHSTGRFTTIILAGIGTETSCSPEELLDFHHENVGIYTLRRSFMLAIPYTTT
jgi:hypothetical protein